MPHYAQIDKNNIVEALSQLSDEVSAPNMIKIPEYDVSLLGTTYDTETGEFTPTPPSDPTPPPQLQQDATLEAIMTGLSDLYAQVEALQKGGETQPTGIRSRVSNLLQRYGILRNTNE